MKQFLHDPGSGAEQSRPQRSPFLPRGLHAFAPAGLRGQGGEGGLNLGPLALTPSYVRVGGLSTYLPAMNACDFAANPFARPDPIHSTQTPWGHIVGCRVSRVGYALPCAALGAVSRLLYIWHLHTDTAISYVSLTKNSSLETSCNGSFYIIYRVHTYLHTYIQQHELLLWSSLWRSVVLPVDPL